MSLLFNGENIKKCQKWVLELLLMEKTIKNTALSKKGTSYIKREQAISQLVPLRELIKRIKN